MGESRRTQGFLARVLCAAGNTDEVDVQEMLLNTRSLFHIYLEYKEAKHQGSVKLIICSRGMLLYYFPVLFMFIIVFPLYWLCYNLSIEIGTGNLVTSTRVADERMSLEKGLKRCTVHVGLNHVLQIAEFIHQLLHGSLALGRAIPRSRTHSLQCVAVLALPVWKNYRASIRAPA